MIAPADFTEQETHSRPGGHPATAWRPGGKVICIEARGLRRHYFPAAPVEGRVYCIREVFDDDGATGCLLVGIQCSSYVGGLECGFRCSRFMWIHS